MNLPISWLKDYINTKKSPKELGGVYSSIGHMLDAPIKKDVLSLEVRQNRPDCLSITGLARELAALEELKLKKPKIKDINLKKYNKKFLMVTDKSVGRFSVLHIKNIKVGESADLIKKRLLEYGVDPINNLVDITNIITIEHGVPLHMFDLSKVKGEKLKIRSAKNGEHFKSLDGTTYKLVSEDTVIADENRVIGLAGIVGGDSTRIDENTTEILLEAANYDQAGIRRSSKRHQIRTEASTRHEKFLHPHGVEDALKRALYIIKEYTKGELVDSEDYFASDPGLTKINFNINEVERLGGIKLKKQQIVKILRSLNFEIQSTRPEILNVTVPYYRTDVKQEADLVEEVLRIFGFNKIPFKKLETAPPENITPESYILEEKIRNTLISLGIDEHITNPMVKSTGSPNEILFENPVNCDMDSLRTNLKNSLEEVLSNYKKHKIEKPAVFEIGIVYYKSKPGFDKTVGKAAAKPGFVSGFREESRVGVIFNDSWSHLEYKGILEGLMGKLGIKNYTVSPDGAIHQGTIELGNLSDHYFYLKIDSIVKAKKSDPTEVITEFAHEMTEDVSFVVDLKVNVGPILTAIKNASKLISNVEVVDTHEDKKFGENKKSVTLRMTYDTSKTSEVRPIRTKIKSLLKIKFSSKIRN